MKINASHLRILFIIFLTTLNSWAQVNTPPTLTANGDQIYCPLTQMNITTNFNIIDPDDTEISDFYIQISAGYINGEDTLLLIGGHPTIISTWNALEGKLTLSGSGSNPILYTDLIPAIADVVFESTNPFPTGERDFSLTVGDANFLPSTGHFYEYISDIGITWNNAKIAADSRTYYGLQGYLVTILSEEEKQLTGEQASGAGWIGGSDSEIEGTWKWVAGPENGLVFWLGNFTGSTPNYAFWNTNEPNQSGDEDFAHITAPGVGILGSWNDLSNTGAASGNYQPKGYIVEYGGMPGDPVLNISASTKIRIPSIDNTIDNFRCGTGSVNLSAFSIISDVLWFDSLTSSTILGTGSVFATPSISVTSTFYALASDNTCLNGERTPVIATINEIPTITLINEDVICESGSGDLSATASNGIINWYQNPSGGSPLTTGNNFTTPVINTTITYYIDATFNNCTTNNRTPVTATVEIVDLPIGNSIQSFCDIENPTLSDLIVTGTDILFYATNTGGSPLSISSNISNNTTYYVSQTINGCESPNRLIINVILYETVVVLNNYPILGKCDNTSFGSDIDGFLVFDLTEREIDLLNGKSSSDFTLTYFRDSGYTSQILTPTAFLNTTLGGQEIYARMTNNLNNSCFTETPFEIQVYELPIQLELSSTLVQCDDNLNGKEEFNLELVNDELFSNITTENFTYYETLIEAENGTLDTEIINPTTYENQVIDNDVVWVRIENTNGCFRTAEILLDVNPSSAVMDTFTTREFYACDDGIDLFDGIATFNFSIVTTDIQNLFSPLLVDVYYYETETEANQEINELDENNYINTSPFFQELWIRIDSSLGSNCLAKGKYIQLNTTSLPEFNVIEDRIVCLNLPPITLEVFNASGAYTYQWFDQSNTLINTTNNVDVSTGGDYIVIATSTDGYNCESTPRVITVTESNIASITVNDVIISDDSENNTITINNDLGIGDYVFALDDPFDIFQNEPFFEMVAPGIHTIYVRDNNDCGISELNVSVVGFPKFFTPNDDGVNDTWQIKGVSNEFFSNTLVFIYDRFGKLVAQIDPVLGWDGLYNSQSLPSSDYWYSAQLIDQNGNIRTKKGHFSMVR